MQALQQSDVSAEELRSVLKELLHKGRGKFQNILIAGSANRGKNSL